MFRFLQHKTSILSPKVNLILAKLPILLLSLLLLNCTSEEQKQFKTLPPKTTGIYFENTLTSTPELNILNYIYYYNGGGVAAGDFNNDGLTDLYFTANQSADKLYLNKGKLQFQDITAAAGIDNASNWTTGVSTVDINQDGLLDIYICKVSNYHNIQGHNLLYLNNGTNDQGIPTFTEAAARYGLDFKGFSTQAAFFDYDLDGDLDMYLLNHSVNPNQNYGRGSRRNEVNMESGDKLFENSNGFYQDVSEKAGIIQSKIGYGLGISVSDLNNDGYPDLYIGNDFYENDYLYLNNGDKTFEEIIQKKDNSIGHTTHFSMGNDIADINNDGLTDILSMDMLPEDLETYKTSGTEFNYQIYQNYIKNGYAHQFMQNTLQLNNGNGTFSEIGYLSGLAATEWSWSPLIADFDNDGFNDIYVSNGIPGATNDMDFINFIANETIQKSLGSGMDEKDMAFIDKIPEKKAINYFFRNKGDHSFENTTETWSTQSPSFSNGSVYTDLDNDGDLDVVVNNINDPAFILENTLPKSATTNSLTVAFRGKGGNPFGIGCTVKIYKDDLIFLKENFTSRGYLSSVAPLLHFGMGTITQIDSIQVFWPSGAMETRYQQSTNAQYVFLEENASRLKTSNINSVASPLVNVEPLFDFQHKDNPNLEFNRNPLTPFAMSNEGPGIAVADVNNDGLDDVFIGGGKQQASELFVQQTDGSFKSVQQELFTQDAMNEDISQIFFDANGDALPDLIVVSGGNEFTAGSPLFPRLYINKNGVFEKDSSQFNIPIDASSVAAVDFDNDGDTDVAILSGNLPHRFGHSPRQFIFENDGFGKFTDVTATLAPELENIGNCNAQVWIDLNGDSRKDLIVAGDWMPVTVFINDGKQLQLQKQNGLQYTNGFWNTLKAADLDNDGDLDLVAGNWGANSRLQASKDEPVKIYSVDVDENDKEETIITYYYKGVETTLASKDELVKQIPGINKSYLSYADFSKADISNLFSKEKLAQAYKKEVYELRSCYFENTGNNQFVLHPLPYQAQLSSVNDIMVDDFNNDGSLELFLVGNNFEISTQLSRLDALHGLLMSRNPKGQFEAAKSQFFKVSGACRTIAKLPYRDANYLVITRNNDHPIFLKIIK